MPPKLRPREPEEAGPSASQGTRSRGRRGRGRGGHSGRGRGGRGGAAVVICNPAAHEGNPAHDFVVKIRSRIRNHLELPLSFGVAMANLEPPGLFLRVDGCPYGPIWVEVSFEEEGSMFLRKGWKTFARWYNLQKGDCLCCRLDGKDSLLVRAFDIYGDRLECWAVSASEADSDEGDDSPRSPATSPRNEKLIASSDSSDSSSDEGVQGREGGDSYSSYERDIKDVKPIPRRARKQT